MGRTIRLTQDNQNKYMFDLTISMYANDNPEDIIATAIGVLTNSADPNNIEITLSQVGNYTVREYLERIQAQWEKYQKEDEEQQKKMEEKRNKPFWMFWKYF